MKKDTFRTIFILYLLALHLLLVYALVRSSRVQAYLIQTGVVKTPTPMPPNIFFAPIKDILAETDKNVVNGRIIFLGDSLTQMLPVQSISSNAINYGVPGDTSKGLAERLSDYSSLEKASVIVLQIGTNDVLNHTDNFDELAAHLPHKPQIYWFAVPPVNTQIVTDVTPEQVADMNTKIKNLCEARSNCRFVDLTARYADEKGNLKKEFHIGDGIHLTEKGYRVWIDALKDIERIS